MKEKEYFVLLCSCDGQVLKIKMDSENLPTKQSIGNIPDM